jgi:hypothetical protein
MNICDLINECGGPDAVGVQFIDTCADDLNWSAKKGITRVTFGTEQPLATDGLPKFGVVIWLDRDAARSAIAKHRRAA